MEYNIEKISGQKSSVAWLSVASNSTLVILKLVIGVMIGSVSVISEAIHSGVDLLAALIALFAVKTSGKPADAGHPFGHGKVENISGTIEAVLIFGAAGWIIYEAVGKLTNPAPIEEAGWGVAVMLISSAANILVSKRLFKIGKKTDSVALQADAWHLQTDVYTSAGVMAGLAIIWIGGFLLPEMNLRWIDPVAAILVALLIIRTAYHLTLESARDLLDVRLPPEEEEHIRRRITAFCPAVRGYHRLRTRKSGGDRFAEFHMLVDANMSVDESHRITDMITSSIREEYPGTTVTIHIEPCKYACNPQCCGNCLLSDKERKEIRTNSKNNNDKARTI